MLKTKFLRNAGLTKEIKFKYDENIGYHTMLSVQDSISKTQIIKAWAKCLKELDFIYIATNEPMREENILRFDISKKIINELGFKDD